MVAAEGLDAVPDLLEVFVLGADIGVDLVGGLEADIEDGFREGAQLSARADETLHRHRVERVYLPISWIADWEAAARRIAL